MARFASLFISAAVALAFTPAALGKTDYVFYSDLDCKGLVEGKASGGIGDCEIFSSGVASVAIYTDGDTQRFLHLGSIDQAACQNGDYSTTINSFQGASSSSGPFCHAIAAGQIVRVAD